MNETFNSPFCSRERTCIQTGTAIKRYPQAAFKAVPTMSLFKTFNLALLYFFTPVFNAYTFAILLFLFPKLAMFVIYNFGITTYARH